MRLVPRWLVRASLVPAGVNLVVSAYLAYEHAVAGATLACPEGTVLNCAKVTSSAYSTLVGIPVAYLGVLFSVAMLAACLPVVWRRWPRLDLVRVAAAVVGVVFVIYLVWAETQLRAICAWCTVVHVATFALMLVLLAGEALKPWPEPAP